MSSTTDRLKLYEEILSLIEKKRAESQDDSLGIAIEKVIIDSQIQDLQKDIYEDPGAIEPFLERLRP